MRKTNMASDQFNLQLPCFMVFGRRCFQTVLVRNHGYQKARSSLNIGGQFTTHRSICVENHDLPVLMEAFKLRLDFVVPPYPVGFTFRESRS